MGVLKEAVETHGIQLKNGGQMTIMDAIQANWGKVEKVMPKHMSSERLFQLVISTIDHEPKLAQCPIETVLSCVMKCSALGLEPSSVDGLGRAYIIPYKNHGRLEATFMLGYKGMIDLARRSGEIKDISSRAVYEGDDFICEFGLDEKLKHIPHATERTPDKLTHVYMVAHFKDGGHYMDVMTKAEVDAVRKQSPAGKNGPWVTHYEEMAKKTIIRRGFKYLPVSVEAQMGAESDETDGGFVDMFTVDAQVIPTENAASLETDEKPALADDMIEPNAEPKQTDDGASDKARERHAVCRSCGNVWEHLAPDAQPSDITLMCCENPDYIIEEC